jgi:hypothetical protein
LVYAGLSWLLGGDELRRLLRRPRGAAAPGYSIRTNS